MQTLGYLLHPCKKNRKRKSEKEPTFTGFTKIAKNRLEAFAQSHLIFVTTLPIRYEQLQFMDETTDVQNEGIYSQWHS